MDELNEAGNVVTEEKLKRFDTDGSPVLTGSVKSTLHWKEHGAGIVLSLRALVMTKAR